MPQQDDRPGDAPTEWLSPALYRQLCDAVDAALFAPPDARDGILAARLGGDQRLLAEARALLASHEQSPRTFITPAVSGSDQTYVGRNESATVIQRNESATVISRRDSATVIVPGSGSRRAASGTGFDALADGTQEMAAIQPPSSGGSGTVSIPPPVGPPSPTPVALADTTPGVPRAVSAPAPEPLPPPILPPPLAQPPSRPAVPAARAPEPAAPEPPAAAPAHAPAAVRSIDIGAPIPTRGGSGMPAGTLLAFLLAGVALIGCGIAIWMWRQANVAQRDAEVRLAQAEKRFTEVRQLGQRLAEVDRLLAVTPDAGAQAARAVLIRTWMQYLTDLQRASGGTDKELLFEVAKGYRQLAAAQGGLSGRTLGDRAGAAKTLQIGERLLNYLDRNSREPDGNVLRELIATLVDLGDVYAVGKDNAAATEQYRRALTAAERLSGAGVGAAEAKQQTDLIRRRIQSGPPAPPAPVVDAAPVTSSEQP
jgi:hypothetical protein